MSELFFSGKGLTLLFENRTMQVAELMSLLRKNIKGKKLKTGTKFDIIWSGIINQILKKTQK